MQVARFARARWVTLPMLALLANCVTAFPQPQYQNLDSNSRYPELTPPLTSAEQSQSFLETCGLNHRTIVAPVRLCGIRDGKQNCLDMTLKMQVLGTKVLYYNSVSENTGIVFDLGKVVDLVSDPRQQDLWRTHTKPGYFPAAVATASFNSGRLEMAFQYRLISQTTGRLASIFGQSMTISACESSCRVLGYTTYFDNGNLMQRDDQNLVGEACAVQ